MRSCREGVECERTSIAATMPPVGLRLGCDALVGRLDRSAAERAVPYTGGGEEREETMVGRETTSMAAWLRACALAAAMAGVLAAAALAGCSPVGGDGPASSGAVTKDVATEDARDGASAGGAAGAATPSTAGKLRVVGTQLVGADGSPVQLRGVSTHGLAWFPQYVNEPFFRELRQDWGANVVRLALYTAESGGYCTDGDREQLEALVEKGVQFAAEADLYAVVDWHVLSDADPNRHKDEAKAFFAKMSARLAAYDNVIYEICNEPNGGTTWEAVKAYAEEVIPVIRENVPDAVIVVGTPTWSQDVDEAAADPLVADNVLYALHFYAATHQQELRDRLAAAVESGLPVFVSEFGICDASGSGRIDYASADAWVSLMDSLDVSYICWNLSNKDETSALFRPDCAKSSGFAESDLSEEGLWLQGVLRGEAPPTAAAASGAEVAGDEGGGSALGGHSIGEESLSFSMERVNAWEADGAPYEQYEVTVTNGGAPVDAWEVAVSLEGSFELVDSWTGSFSPAGDTLRIANAAYNGSLATGASASDIGFIVRLG